VDGVSFGYNWDEKLHMEALGSDFCCSIFKVAAQTCWPNTIAVRTRLHALMPCMWFLIQDAYIAQWRSFVAQSRAMDDAVFTKNDRLLSQVCQFVQNQHYLDG